MKKYYSNLSSIACLAILTFLFTSYIPSDLSSESKDAESGKYILQANGSSEILMEGPVEYYLEDRTDRHGRIYHTLNLKLRNDLTGHHQFELFITDVENSFNFNGGDYLFSENIEGFLKEFKGVFGVANIDQFGELPFFSKEGQITITRIDQNTLSGRLQLTLNNTLGELIEIKGNFAAAKGF